MQIESVRTKTSSPRIEIYGWAIDRRASSGVGVSGIHFYAYPAGGGDPIFLGAATLWLPRDEVAAMFGARFRNAHFFVRGDLPSGTYQVVAYALSAATGRFDNVRVVQLIVP